jgi:preprotein translocase SecE subunit
MAKEKNIGAESDAPEKKPNKFLLGCKRFFGRIGNYLHDCVRELKKIVWYGKKPTFTATVLVTGALIVFAVIIGALDFGITQLIKLFADLY